MARVMANKTKGNPIDVKPQVVGQPEQIDKHSTRVRLQYPEGTRLKGQGDFRLELLLYKLAGVDLQSKRNSMLATFELPPKIVTPFLIMIVISMFTPRNSKEGLDRYYAKMKTPVDPDPKKDEAKLKAALNDPDRLEKTKLFPGTSWEMQRPNMTDVLGFVICVAICFAVIGIAVWVSKIGA